MSACNIDRASEVGEFYLEVAIKNRQIMTGDSLKECAECGDDIPEERQKLKGVTLCIDCKTVAEKKGAA